MADMTVEEEEREPPSLTQETTTSNCPSDTDEVEGDVEHPDLGTCEELSDKERLLLFLKGEQFQSQNKTNHALHCYLGCIKGLKLSSVFPSLPKCLQNLAELYAAEGDFSKAVQFMQATKLFYETSLVRLGETEHGDGEPIVNSDAGDETAGSGQHSTAGSEANQYENLSRMCLKEKNMDLALEYCARAADIRKVTFGEKSKEAGLSLDLFACVFAEMGKVQYEEATKTLKSEISKAAPLDKVKSSKPIADEQTSQKPRVDKTEERPLQLIMWFVWFPLLFAVLATVLWWGNDSRNSVATFAEWVKPLLVYIK